MARAGTALRRSPGEAEPGVAPRRSRPVRLIRSCRCSAAGPPSECSRYSSSRWWCSWPPRCCRATRPMRSSGATATPARRARAGEAASQPRVCSTSTGSGCPGCSPASSATRSPTVSRVGPGRPEAGRLLGARVHRRGDRHCPRHGTRSARGAPQGRLVRPCRLGRRPRGNVAAGVRRRHRPHHPLLDQRQPPVPAVSLLPRARTSGASRALGPAGSDARYRDRPLHLPDDARRDGRVPRVGLRGDGPPEGHPGVEDRGQARPAERHRARRSRSSG